MDNLLFQESEFQHGYFGTVKRIFLGDPIPTKERETFSVNDNTLSGSIGFLDYQIRFQEIPKNDGLVNTEVLMIHIVGIEPNYKRKNYGEKLVSRAEEIARNNHIDYVTGGILVNQQSQDFMSSLGYELYNYSKSVYCVKKLEPIIFINVLYSSNKLSYDYHRHQSL